MKQFRTCNSAQLNTGASKCVPSFENIRGAILVPPGTALPVDLTADKFEELQHAELATRIYALMRFTNYAKEGGEVQTAANGYDGESPTGYSARKDTFTLDHYDAAIAASLSKGYSKNWDVYFFDEQNTIHGIEVDGVLYGFPMNSIFPQETQFRTDAAKPEMTVTFLHSDAKSAVENYNYRELNFKIYGNRNLTIGLTPVELVKVGKEGTDYKLLEKVGKFDVTPVYGELIADAGNTVLNGATSAASYNSETGTLTIATSAGVVPTLKSPKVLFENDIKGIEQV